MGIKRKDRYCLEHWQETPGFITKEHEIPEMQIKILGYFPYHTARIQNDDGMRMVHIPRSVFRELEQIFQELHIADNKAVYVIEDLAKFGTDNFLLMLKDFYATVGRWDDIIDY